MAVNERIYKQELELDSPKSSEDEQDNEETVTKSDMTVFMEEYITREEAIQQDNLFYE